MLVANFMQSIYIYQNKNKCKITKDYGFQKGN